ncbi:hypothetical protein [Aegicerativicinus sediminis]|uniref:hypothetical protein n=1 Tax=Aegicerativicinus sediminis TaxID=2893202 RepID=UPI001E4D2BAF|nr:hypothetical protein [Aegicerativicinus sediminis]
MAPIKFEESIKESLEKRTISPSQEGWKKLSKRLDTSNSHKKGNTILWWSLAASVVVLFGLGMFMFNNGVSDEKPIQIVETKTNSTFQQEEFDKAASGEDETENSLVVSGENANPERIDPKSKSNQTQNNTTSNNVVEPSIANSDEKSVDGLKESEINLIDNVSSVVVIEEIKNEKIQSMTPEAETDSLLKRAQRNLLKGMEVEKEIITVDANSLLQEVEGELEESFRTKMFETLIDGIEAVKTTVAQRNN